VVVTIQEVSRDISVTPTFTEEGGLSISIEQEVQLRAGDATMVGILHHEAMTIFQCSELMRLYRTFTTLQLQLPYFKIIKFLQ
jgi:hypothetical protein